MDFFQFVADMLHLMSFFILIQKILKNRNCSGVSAKTQELYLIVFLTRYPDLFMYIVSIYNTSMKLAFIGATLYILYLMRYKQPQCLTYQREQDEFPHFLYLLPAAGILTLLIHTKFQLFELSWSFSIWLEALAILPQLKMLTKMQEVENLTGNYVAALGLYRFFYILSWIWRYYQKPEIHWVKTLGGLVQTALYTDFLYYYWKR